MKIYHGSSSVLKNPEIRTVKYHPDFYFGFYCTFKKEPSIRKAGRFKKRIVNVYDYEIDESLNILKFDEMTEEWLDFVAASRNGTPHDYDIVEGPMADDVIYNYIQEFLDGKITREAFWALAKFKYPTHQICFNTKRALKTLTFIERREVYAEK